MSLLPLIQTLLPVLSFSIFLVGFSLLFFYSKEKIPYFCEPKQLLWIVWGFFPPLIYFFIHNLLLIVKAQNQLNTLTDKCLQLIALLCPLCILLLKIAPSRLYPKKMCLLFFEFFISIFVLANGCILLISGESHNYWSNAKLLKTVLIGLLLFFLFFSLWITKKRLVVKYFLIVPAAAFRLLCLLFFICSLAAIVAVFVHSQWVYICTVNILVFLYAAYFMPLIIKNIGRGVPAGTQNFSQLLKEENDQFGFPKRDIGKRQRARFKDLYKQLTHLMEVERPYTNPDLTVQELASRLGTNKTYLSNILKLHGNSNFNNFINSYRVRDAQRVFAQNRQILMKDLCKEVGFNSESVFTDAFKKQMGCPPGEWCKRQLQTNAYGKEKET